MLPATGLADALRGITKDPEVLITTLPVTCNEILTDYEASVRSVFSREYVSLCKHCLGTIKTDCVAVGNINLMSDLDDIGEADSEAENGLSGDFPDDDYYMDIRNDR